MSEESKAPRVSLPRRKVLVTLEGHHSSKQNPPNLVTAPSSEDVQNNGKTELAASPTNGVVLERAALLKEQLPPTLEPGIVKVREFFIKQIAPFALSFYNGAADAESVLRTALEEDPQMRPLLNYADSNVVVAMRSRITVFVKNFFQLNEEEAALYLSRVAAQDFGGNDGLNRLLHEMLKVSSVPKSEEGGGLQVPGVQSPEGNRSRGRTRSAAAPTRKREGRRG